MKYSYAFVAVFAVFAVAYAAEDECAVACPMIYEPVCGTDGAQFITFSNKCMMQNAGCGTKSVWRETRMADCEHKTARTSEDECLSVCQTIFAPVCGTDGKQFKTFSNKCLMENAGCMTKSVWRETRMADCEPATARTSEDECLSVCPTIYAPVCGSDGKQYKTFSNKCLMENAGCMTKSVWHETRMADCEPATARTSEDECLSVCPTIYAPVCGSDGKQYKTFSNKCLMENAGCMTKSTWHETRMADCEPETARTSGDNCFVHCAKNYYPVCGTDGTQFKMFMNLCLMGNAGCMTKTTWTETRMADCEPETARTSDDDCVSACQMIYEPVCGTDGKQFKTFSNKCMMGNAGCKTKSVWRETRMADCQTETARTSCAHYCPFIYKPVCASNGESFEMFDNKCLFDEKNCEDNYVWRLTKMASCSLRTEPKKNCLRACPFIYDPVCASNGANYEIFDNSCVLEERNCEDNNKWRLTKMASCTEKKSCNQACPMNYLPVCGFDGTNYETFSNECVYQSKNCLSNFSWKMVKTGEC